MPSLICCGTLMDLAASAQKPLDCARSRLLTSSRTAACGRRDGPEGNSVTIIITDDDVQRLLPMADCIEAMRVAFRDFADGRAVNRPRMRYLAEHPDPER